MSSFEPTPVSWLHARSFVAADASDDDFVPDLAPPEPERDLHRLDHEPPASSVVLTAEASEAIRQEAIAEARLRLDPAMAALEDAAAQLAVQRDDYLRAQRQLLVDLAIEIASGLVGRAIEVDREPLTDRLEAALALVSGDEPVKVSLNPDDYETMTGGTDRERAEVPAGGRDVIFVADPALASGDAVVVCGATSVDARMHSLLGRVRELLTQDAAASEAIEEVGA